MLTEAQKRMLDTLMNGEKLNVGTPIGLSDLSNPEFVTLLEGGLVGASWASIGSMVARITDRGRAALNDPTMLPVSRSSSPPMA